MRDTTVRLTDDSADPDAEHFAVDRVDRLADNLTGVRCERYMVTGHPGQFQRCTVISGGAGVLTVGDYPQDGGAVPDGTSTTTAVKLHGSAPDWDITGMLILWYSTGGGTAANLGEVRRILAYNTSTHVATVAALPVAPASGDVPIIVLDTEGANEIEVKTEFNDTAANTDAIIVRVVRYDFPHNPPTSGATQARFGVKGVGRAPHRTILEELTIANTDDTTHPSQASHRHGEVRSSIIRGAVGCKLRLMVPPANSKKVILWASVL